MLTEKAWNIFKAYEAKFGVWLYTAWDFDGVDWDGLAKAAEKSIENNSPLTEDEISKYHGKFEEGKIY